MAQLISPFATTARHVLNGVRKNGLKSSTSWKSTQKMNATNISGLYSMEWNSLSNKNKIM